MRKTVRLLSAGAVVYRDTGKGRRYLLLRNVKGHWDFPKGKVEPGEKRDETIRRETAEECGIVDLIFHPIFLKRCRWSYSEKGTFIRKTAVFRLGCTDESRLKLSPEHSEGAWLPLAGALSALRFINQRRLLMTADRMLARR
jgi:8-oxo-dGTP pyrophosphatase MutT (NUDIX family)